MLREIVLDTETTGFYADKTDRIIEIGCIEIVNRIPTGHEFHAFVNPERDVPAESQAVHGITSEFLRDKPLFKDVARPFVEFIGDDPLVIHNANFDVGFLNAELRRLGLGPIGMHRVVDTLALARRRHPAGPNTLDALCKRYGIDNSKRTKHGALVDSELLAAVYVELLGERQAALTLVKDGAGRGLAGRAAPGWSAKKGGAVRPRPLAPRLTAAEEAAHRSFVETLGPKALWLKVGPPGGNS